MDFVNETKVAAGWTIGFEPDGREILVVVIKATFTIPQAGDEPALADEQVSLSEEDKFTGEPGLSAPLYETDYAHRKPMCDVLLNGSAYPPLGGRATNLTVSFQVGPMVKAFSVVGNRVWRVGVTGVRASEPEPFDLMPISYDIAFGGTENSKGDPAKVMTFLDNPVGRGYCPSKEKVGGRALPNTEELDKRVTNPGGPYRPMAFGPVGRNWRPRVQYAGTYDQQWLEHRAPLWPDDFDYRYFQAAPVDQQIRYPVGGDEVVLKNLTPDGNLAFQLPNFPMPVWFLPYDGKDKRLDAVLDTVLIEPDVGVFMLGWRAVLPLRRNCFELKQVIVGEMSEAWKRTRKHGGKPYYRGLAELVKARKGLL
jgi:hypothetical protein